MRSRPSAALLAAVLILVLLPVGVAASGGLPFPDLTGHWSEFVVRRALDSGWVNGYPDGTFRPEATLSRAEFTKLLVAALGRPPRPGGPVRYTDTASHWVQTQGWLAAAEEAGILVPDEGQERFEPDLPITRQMIAIMAVRALGRDTEARLRDGSGLPFADREEIGGGQGSVEAAFARGLVAGFPDGTFRPENTATRAQAVVIVGRLLDAVAKETPSLLPAPEWQSVAPEAWCGTPDTRLLRVGIRWPDAPLSPQAGGMLRVFLHNNTNLCGSAGKQLRLEEADLSLQIVPLRFNLNQPGVPVARVSLSSPPGELVPGAAIELPVTVGGNLPPGWYTAEVAGKLTVSDGTNRLKLDLPGPYGQNKSPHMEFLVTGSTLGKGEALAEPDQQGLSLGSIPVPAMHASWAARARFDVDLPLYCTPGREQVLELTEERHVAVGPGFATLLSSINGGQVPGEATELRVMGNLTLRPCGPTGPGEVLTVHPVTWRFRLAEER